MHAHTCTHTHMCILSLTLRPPNWVQKTHTHVHPPYTLRYNDNGPASQTHSRTHTSTHTRTCICPILSDIMIPKMPHKHTHTQTHTCIRFIDSDIAIPKLASECTHTCIRPIFSAIMIPKLRHRHIHTHTHMQSLH